jgi:hypothetical protein
VLLSWPYMSPRSLLRTAGPSTLVGAPMHTTSPSESPSLTSDTCPHACDNESDGPCPAIMGAFRSSSLFWCAVRDTPQGQENLMRIHLQLFIVFIFLFSCFLVVSFSCFLVKSSFFFVCQTTLLEVCVQCLLSFLGIALTISLI